MATETTHYQCPACTGPLHFAAGSGKLECEYCDSSFEIKSVEHYYAEKEQQAAQARAEAEAHPGAEDAPWDSSELQENWDGETERMRSYTCPTCSAELICDETTAASSCPYCGNPTVIPGQFSGVLRPDYVIPFQLEKKDAIAAVKAHYKGKIFLPRTFLSDHTIGKIQGVYVPFWLYDGEASGEMVFTGKRIRTYRRGDDEITETDHYLIERSGSLAFEKVPVDASSKMPDEYMDSIEPFDYVQLKPFSTAYMPGFLADKYDLTMEQGNNRADQRCAQTLRDALRSTVIGYDIVETRTSNVRLRRGKVHYAMLPVWLLNVKWGEKTFLFAVNGQTGKTAGTLPVSYGKVAAMFAGLFASLSALGYLLAQIING